MSGSTTTRTRPRLLPEFALIFALLYLYRKVRYMVRDHAVTARHHAVSVVHFERRLGMFTEASLQRVVLHSRGVIAVLNRYYASVHFTITALFVVWVYLLHADHYRTIRNWFALVTASGLLLHVTYPLAPPRMLPSEGFIDTLQRYGPHIYNTDPHVSLANQFAAMPSLHFGWSVMVAIGCIAIKRTRLSLLSILHPLLTLTSIVATGNHYWLDAAVAFVLVIVAGKVVMTLSSTTAARRFAFVEAPPSTLVQPAWERIDDEEIRVFQGTQVGSKHSVDV